MVTAIAVGRSVIAVTITLVPVAATVALIVEASSFKAFFLPVTGFAKAQSTAAMQAVVINSVFIVCLIF
jgi:hypothetical protein